jgi:D-inositol-3-phosphate glycosyltransferase
VIASAVGGLQSLIDDGVTGWLIPNRDPQVYADRLRTLFGNPDLAKAMGIAAATRARRYAWSATAHRIKDAFEELAAQAPIPCGSC